jgi:hypothetical protein
VRAVGEPHGVALIEPLEVVAKKPGRLNFAGVCLWCEEAHCERSRCIELHARSEWMICDECGGFSLCGCSCVHGVIEATPVRLPPPEVMVCR